MDEIRNFFTILKTTDIRNDGFVTRIHNKYNVPNDSLYLLRKLDAHYIALCSEAITDIEPLRDLEKLQILLLNGTNINNVESLAHNTALTDLDLSNTKVTDITPLKELVNLEYLNLSKTHINNIEPLINLPKLKILDLTDCVINDVSSIVELKNLEYLTIRG